MATKNPRLNVVLNPHLFKLVKLMALQESKTMSMIAQELIQFAMERAEDYQLSLMAMQREKMNSGKKRISHEEAWNQLV